MNTYHYQARNKEGQLVNDYLEAHDEQEALGRIFSLGYTIVSLNQQTAAASEFSLEELFAPRIKAKDLIFFSRQLSTLLKAGVPITESLESISNQSPSKVVKQKAGEILKDLREGKALSDCLARHPQDFPELMLGMVRVGEISGGLHDSLARFSELKTEELELSSRVMAVMIYPIILVIASLTIVTFMVIFILPKFTTIFNSYGTALPLPTKILLWVSDTLKHYWQLILLIGAGFGFWLRWKLNQKDGRYAFDSFMMSLPGIGDFYLKATLAPLFHTVSELLTMGVPLFDILRVAGGTISNTVIRKAVGDIREEITRGTSLSEAFLSTGVFPMIVIQMIIVGEKSGSMSQMLQEISSFYEREITYAIRNMTAVIEPVLLISMGGMVGFIALAVLLPIFNMVKVFKH